MERIKAVDDKEISKVVFTNLFIIDLLRTQPREIFGEIYGDFYCTTNFLRMIRLRTLVVSTVQTYHVLNITPLRGGGGGEDK
jgi:hypothetical protein